MSTSEDDSDVPEQVSLSTSKRQVIGRRRDVAKELAQAGSKRKEHNRERDRQLKQQSSNQRTDLIPDEESPPGEDEVAKDPRLLPDHLFVAAFSQPSPAPGPSVPKDAPRKTQRKVRKRASLTPKDRIIGQAFPLLQRYSADSCRQFPGCPDTLQSIRPGSGQTHTALIFRLQVFLAGAKRQRDCIPKSDSGMATQSR